MLLLTVLNATWQKLADYLYQSLDNFSQSKDSNTKFNLAKRKLRKMRAFARFRNESWSLDLAYVDKLEKENSGVNFLLVRQDLFDRTVNAKGMKTKDSQETVKTFSSMIKNSNRPKKGLG